MWWEEWTFSFLFIPWYFIFVYRLYFSRYKAKERKLIRAVVAVARRCETTTLCPSAWRSEMRILCAAGNWASALKTDDDFVYSSVRRVRSVATHSPWHKPSLPPYFFLALAQGAWKSIQQSAATGCEAATIFSHVAIARIRWCSLFFLILLALSLSLCQSLLFSTRPILSFAITYHFV